MGLFKRKKQLPVILLASLDATLVDIIPDDVFYIREAFSTRGVINGLADHPALIVIDFPDLLESDEFPKAALAASLESVQADGIPVVNSARFLAEKEQHISAALLSTDRKTAVRFLPSRTVLIANYAGGVGKTTLTMAIARRFHASSGLGAAIIEMGIGGSSFNARLSGERPSLYDVVTQRVEPGRWEGVDVYPLDGREARILGVTETERTLQTLDEIVQAHTLVVLDASPASPLWPHLLSRATDILVVTSPRPDSITQTESILDELAASLNAVDPKPKLHLVLNMARSLGDKISLSGQVKASLPFDDRKAERYHHALADPLLELLYPQWNGGLRPQSPKGKLWRGGRHRVGWNKRKKRRGQR